MRESRSSSSMFTMRNAGLEGKSIVDAGLRGLPDAFLVAIERGPRTLHAVAPTEILQADDVLWFAGSSQGLISLRKIPGLLSIALVFGPCHVFACGRARVLMGRTFRFARTSLHVALIKCQQLTEPGVQGFLKWRIR
jgi:hypothetical protein